MLHVAGFRSFNNELLSEYLGDQLQQTVNCVPSPDLPAVIDNFPLHQHLVFWDSQTLNTADPWKTPPLQRVLKAHNCRTILFNLEAARSLESAALQHGVHGVLYDRQPIDFYTRALYAVLDGELWFPRSILEARLLQDAAPTPLSRGTTAGLTPREGEILRLLSDGLSNEDIAARLYISPHTVKTHAYNIYRKINVTTRLQAAMWLKGQVG